MTQFNQIELIYNQFLNVVNEIAVMIEKEEYEAAAAKFERKDNLIKQLSMAKKTIKFTGEEKLKMQSIEDEIRESDKNMLEHLTTLRAKMADELKVTKKKLKLSSAYERPANRQGAIVDIEE
jgi:hypothetical protein